MSLKNDPSEKENKTTGDSPAPASPANDNQTVAASSREEETIISGSATEEATKLMPHPPAEEGQTRLTPNQAGYEATIRSAESGPPADRTLASAPGQTDADLTMPPPEPKPAEKETKVTPQGKTQGERNFKDTTTDVSRGRLLQNRYQIIQILGEGGFGAAYLAEDVKLRRKCVVKRMKIPKGTPAKQVQLYQANFEREASLLAKLNEPGHPNIPEIYDYFSDESGNYLVMKYIEGSSLKGIVSNGPVPWREAVRYIVDVSDALSYMHTHGEAGDEPVMHRDIKPDNILLGEDNRVWLVDFGLAKADPVESSGDIKASMAAGTLGYTPLEQWLGRAVPTSDVYALGATLHHLVTGVNPADAHGGTFNPLKLKELHGVFPAIRQINKELPQDLETIISQATATEPEQRLTARQLKEQLEALISQGQAAALYTFKSGESAKTARELVNLCEKYRKEAQQYLERGEFERWFRLINRNDLAEAAVQAVKQGKSSKEMLERFLKLLLPNIALLRLRRTTWRLTRAAIVILLIVTLTVGVIGAAGALAAGSFIRQTIASAGWNFNKLDLEAPNQFTKVQIDQNLQALVGVYVDNIEAEMRPPDHVDINGRWSGFDFTIPVAVALQNGKPNLSFTGIGNVPLPFVADQISQGFNQGIDDAFQNSPVDFTQLTVTDTGVTVEVAESRQAGRPALPTATPPPSPTPTITPTPSPTSTPEGLALVTIFNETGRDIILDIEGEIFEMEVNDSKAIEKQPGVYNFTVKFKDTGAIAAEGQKEWEVKTYKWRIQ